jgi:predicted nucleotide-binding protein (sugar kinase/HSP70/actin superfamily)
MRITFPHMGQLYIGLKALFNNIGVEPVIPPFTTRRTLSLATQYSPDGLCIPYKIILGNMIEGLEKGADTILTVGGTNTCRMGYYHRVQEQILRNIGYKDLQMFPIGLANNKFGGFMGVLKKCSPSSSWPRIISAFNFAIYKMTVLDDLEILANEIRPVEAKIGAVSQVYRAGVSAVDKASDLGALRKVSREYKSELKHIVTLSDRDPLRILIVGEIYVVLDPFSNLDIEQELAKMGVITRRSLYTSRWIKWSLFLNPLGIDQWGKVHRAARPYLTRDIGGDGWETVGEKISGAHHFDGMVHLSPFTCMPETMAQNFMLNIKEGLPVLSVSLDEQTSKAGLVTRLEAFVDMIKRKKLRNLRIAHESISRH